MAVAPTYPGVYIEEVSSGVRTLTGVATSITAFIGYTSRGKVNEPVTLHSYADFEREFGGLAVDSPLSYCVKHFFQNGGSDAIVVRVAAGAAAASVTIRNKPTLQGSPVLTLTAASEGTWGNNLRVDVDYNTANPASLFNLIVSEVVMRNGQAVVTRPPEVFRNLTMNDQSPTYAVAVINSTSQLVVSSVPAGLPTEQGWSESASFAGSATVTITANECNLRVFLDEMAPLDISLVLGGPKNLASIANEIAAKINALAPLSSVAGSATIVNSQQRIKIQRMTTSLQSAVRFGVAAENDASSLLKLGLANGGVETDGAAGARPCQTGTIGRHPVVPTIAHGALEIRVYSGGSLLNTITGIQLWGLVVPGSIEDVVTKINEALVNQAKIDPELVGATAQFFGGNLRILPGITDAGLSFELAGSAIDNGNGNGMDLLATDMEPNLAQYELGSMLMALGQVAGKVGNNGSAPLSGDISGLLSEKTGFYALEKVDLFNLLVIPEACTGGMDGVLIEAIAYCTQRRAMMLIDAPPDKAKIGEIQAWINGPKSAPLRSRNSAIFYPRISAPDPLKNNQLRHFPATGAVAGLCARTDAERGVWKAPAGTSATIVGATGLQVSLTDKEHGGLNPLALNCLRTFPVIGTVNWGARTGKGADQLTDEYKYIPVRRLALFLEESLYRGTQWVVFEPNDEPLWAQIRLNLGAFMHNLFSQGAFQGSTPRHAYFVKCDKETTTQNDIDLGRVNIRVGFAPLKPAEFVIIQIQQIAGAIVA